MKSSPNNGGLGENPISVSLIIGVKHLRTPKRFPLSAKKNGGNIGNRFYSRSKEFFFDARKKNIF